MFTEKKTALIPGLSVWADANMVFDPEYSLLKLDWNYKKGWNTQVTEDLEGKQHKQRAKNYYSHSFPCMVCPPSLRWASGLCFLLSL